MSRTLINLSLSWALKFSLLDLFYFNWDQCNRSLLQGYPKGPCIRLLHIVGVLLHLDTMCNTLSLLHVDHVLYRRLRDDEQLPEQKNTSEWKSSPGATKRSHVNCTYEEKRTLLWCLLAPYKNIQKSYINWKVFLPYLYILVADRSRWSNWLFEILFYRFL